MMGRQAKPAGADQQASGFADAEIIGAVPASTPPVFSAGGATKKVRTPRGKKGALPTNPDPGAVNQAPVPRAAAAPSKTGSSAMSGVWAKLNGKGGGAGGDAGALPISAMVGAVGVRTAGSSYLPNSSFDFMGGEWAAVRAAQHKGAALVLLAAVLAAGVTGYGYMTSQSGTVLADSVGETQAEIAKSTLALSSATKVGSLTQAAIQTHLALRGKAAVNALSFDVDFQGLVSDITSHVPAGFKIGTITMSSTTATTTTATPITPVTPVPGAAPAAAVPTTLVSTLAVQPRQVTFNVSGSGIDALQRWVDATAAMKTLVNPRTALSGTTTQVVLTTVAGVSSGLSSQRAAALENELFPPPTAPSKPGVPFTPAPSTPGTVKP